MAATNDQSTEYQGSQAYAQTLSSDEAVSPNSGSVSYSRALVSLRGKTASTGLSVKATFSPGTDHSFGLPQNWTLDISFTIPHKSLTVQGRTYVVDPDWVDQSDYASGLRYLNHHGLKFERIYPTMPLPSGRPGFYGWRFLMADGAIEYFDEYGKLLEHADLFGNSISYSYIDETSGPRDCKIHHIIDTWDQVILFDYDMDTSLRVTCPDSSTTLLNFGSDGISSIHDAMGHKTDFTYRQLHGLTLFDTIVTPTGLVSKFEYLDLPALDGHGKPYSIPACSLHIHQDLNGVELDRTRFIYGEATNFANFTGSSIGCTLSDTQDSLMESKNQDFLYDVAVLRLAPDGTTLQMSRVYYNYLHLAMREEHYLIDTSGAPIPAYLTVNAFNIPFDEHARSTTFTLPTSVEHLQWDAARNTYQGMRLVMTTYTDFGNPLSITDAAWDPSTRSYQLRKSCASEYVAVSWHGLRVDGEMLRTQTEKDCLVDQEKRTEYTLTQDLRSVASVMTSYRNNSIDAWLPWKVKSYEYDHFGRVTSESLAWAQGASYPAGSVGSFRKTVSYSFEKSAALLSVTTTDPLGGMSRQKHLVSVTDGPVVESTTAMGIVEAMQYDSLGRLVSGTDGMGNVSTTVYVIGHGSSATHRTANGYITRIEFDALGREVRVLDNGLDGTAEPSRVVVQTEFDAVSRISKTVNMIGLSAMRSYDALSRLTTSTDIYGNVTTKTYDDAAFQSTSRINGDVRLVETSNAVGQVIESVVAGDSDARPDYQLVTRTMYSAFGKPILTTLHKRLLTEAAGEIALTREDTSYNVENNAVKLVRVGTVSDSSRVEADGAPTDEVIREVEYDIFGHSITYRKTSVYHDRPSFAHSGPISEYDTAGRLRKLTNQLGQAETYEYDSDGRIIKMQRYDGSVFINKYDNLGQHISTMAPGNIETQRTFLTNGRLSSQTTNDGHKMTYDYSLDGCATAIHYWAGPSQKFVLDKYSRVAKQVDSAGVTTDLTYDDRGRLVSKQSAGTTVSYTFGMSNHTHGVLLQTSIVTAAGKVQNRQHVYDAFGREIETIDRDAAGRVLLHSIYARDARGRILACEKRSDVLTDSKLTFMRRFDYDGLSQLVRETRTGGASDPDVREYSYDGNYNVISIFSRGERQDLTYNAIDQRTDPGFEYDSNGRLIRDPDGKVYTYDSQDRLLTCQGGTTATTYSYHPDGSLAARHTQNGTIEYYHQGSKINVNRRQDTPEAWSSYMFHGAGHVGLDKTSQRATLYVESQDSAVLSVAAEDRSELSPTIFSNLAYGEQTSESGALYGWHQELTDSDTGLVYLQSRYYNPRHRTFLSLDGSRSQENRYAFCHGDPVNYADSSGHEGEAIAAAVIGNIVGIAVTVATGGLAVEIGAAISAETNMTAVGIAAATVSGAAGSLAGDATSAAIQNQSFSWARAGEDLLAGAVGGAVGAGSGGVASEKVMRFLIWTELPEATTVTNFGMATSLLVGGGAGSFASAATSAKLNGQPVFSSTTALAGLQGAAMAGAGGGLWASAALVGVGDKTILPVFVTGSELDRVLVRANAPPRSTLPNNELYLMSTPKENVVDFGLLDKQPERMTRAPEPGGNTHLTIVGHGSKKHLWATVRYKNEVLYRPVLARHVGRSAMRYFEAGPGVAGRDIKLLSCQGALANAQIIADVTGMNVWASYSSMSVEETVQWEVFYPR